LLLLGDFDFHWFFSSLWIADSDEASFI